MSTDLRILIDEHVPEPLARAIMAMPSVRAVYVLDTPELIGCEDDGIIAYAEKEKRITVTMERSFQRYRVCTHQGIIVLTSRERHAEMREEVFRRFLLSGYRKYVKNAFTRLSQNEATIKDHDGEKVVHF
ncbi:MAG: DUF5615 family PIN-like protein [Acidobacteria bacterium]|nr:DUF5615 family PIN-like protein [Acidobacteriota bacterium]